MEMSDLDRLWVRYQELRRDGRPVSLEELCGKRADLIDELRRRGAEVEATIGWRSTPPLDTSADVEAARSSAPLTIVDDSVSGSTGGGAFDTISAPKPPPFL